MSCSLLVNKSGNLAEFSLQGIGPYIVNFYRLQLRLYYICCRQEKELFNDDYKVIVTLNIFRSRALGGHWHAIFLCFGAAEFSSVLKDCFRYMPDGT